MYYAARALFDDIVWPANAAFSVYIVWFESIVASVNIAIVY